MKAEPMTQARMAQLIAERKSMGRERSGAAYLPDGFIFTATTLGERAVVGVDGKLFARWSGGEFTFYDAPRAVIDAVLAQPSTWPGGDELVSLRQAALRVGGVL